MALERRVIEADITRSYWGLGAGVFVAVICFAAASFMAYEGYALAGTLLGSLDLGTVIAIFVYGTVSRRSERQQRVKMLSGES